MVERVEIELGEVTLDGDLVVPAGAGGVVVFAHGSGSSRHSPRNRQVADGLNDAGLATLLMDLLTSGEEATDARTREHRFDIDLLGERVVGAVDWVTADHRTARLPVGVFGASTGAAAALVAAAARPEVVAAVVSRGGRPDLAGTALPRVKATTLLIVGARDDVVLGLNRDAADLMAAPTQLEVVAGASHLFEEPGKLEEVTRLASGWFTRHLNPDPPA